MDGKVSKLGSENQTSGELIICKPVTVDERLLALSLQIREIVAQIDKLAKALPSQK